MEWETINSHFQHIDLVRVGGIVISGVTPVIGQGGGNESVGIAEISSLSSGGQERLSGGGVPGLSLGGAESNRQIDSQYRIGVGREAVEVKGLGVVAQCIAWGQRTERGIARLFRVSDGLGQVDRLGGTCPVAGLPAHPRARSIPAEFLQGLGNLSVASCSSVVTEVLVQGVLDEGVGEAVTARVGHRAHQSNGSGRVEDVEQVVLARLR